jgi:hypothetical protein
LARSNALLCARSGEFKTKGGGLQHRQNLQAIARLIHWLAAFRIEIAIRTAEPT